MDKLSCMIPLILWKILYSCIMISVKMCICQLQKHKNFKHGMLKENSKAWKSEKLKALKSSTTKLHYIHHKII